MERKRRKLRKSSMILQLLKKYYQIQVYRSLTFCYFYPSFFLQRSERNLIMAKTLLILSSNSKGFTKGHSDFLLDRVVSLSNSTSNNISSIFVGAQNSVQAMIKIHEYSFFVHKINMIILSNKISKRHLVAVLY